MPKPKRTAASVKNHLPRARWAAARLFAMDVDGVLTDGTILTCSDGTESKRFSILDGLGLVLLRDAGFPLAWISGRASAATTARANELRIPHLIQGRIDKLTALTEIVAQLGIPLQNCIYMGDDTIDVPAMRAAGIAVSVPGAMPEALAAADYVTRRAPGLGAVREICEHILSTRGTRGSR